ncbi:MAG: hypothetical protein HYV33_01510 [Candidatus Kerfeldbacteria bacterium]|nr:hypothetical protein [Candidatus Kerfeldbacteria bacterium]
MNELPITSAGERARTSDMTDALAAVQALRDARRKQPVEQEEQNALTTSTLTNGSSPTESIQTTTPETTGGS